jgi:tryptophan-rich sensory protein
LDISTGVLLRGCKFWLFGVVCLYHWPVSHYCCCLLLPSVIWSIPVTSEVFGG